MGGAQIETSRQMANENEHEHESGNVLKDLGDAAHSGLHHGGSFISAELGCNSRPGNQVE